VPLPTISPEFDEWQIELHGRRVIYRIAGSGPPVVLIHGMLNSSSHWRSVALSLANEYTVVAPDLIGHGDSAAPRGDYSLGAHAASIRDLLAAIGIDRATIVGHSLGGGVAMQFAYQYPERCERLVLVSTGGVSRDVHPLLRIATAPPAGFALPILGLRATRVALRGVFHLLRSLETDIGRDADDLIRVFDALPDWAARMAFLRTVRAAVDWRGQHVTMLDRAYLASFMPTMIIWGKRDGVIPYSHALVAHAALPGSRLETFENAGHFPHHSDPARFLAVISDFCSETKPAPFSAEAWRELLRRGRA
jgi:pimeloyl-ACP methyl ester carboxylesterase